MPAVAKPRAQATETAKRPTALRETAHTVAHFDIRYRQFLDQHGKPMGDLPAFARDRDLMVRLYRHMVLTRTFDARAVSLQRTGQLGTFPSSLGQEAAMVGLAAAMHDDDVLLGTYREQGAQLWRGVTLLELFRYWGGNESGTNYAVPRQDFPPSIPIATHTLHAVGVATAMKLRKQKRCAVCVLGDGATSKGDFYEALNVAGVWNLPVVFVVNNNGWAISVPLGKQTACETLAQKAIAGGFEGEQVDGNDVIAVRHAVSEGVERARAGKGPSLVETLTYRLSDHTTADDATRYRPDEEVSAAWAKDPVPRLRAWLGAQGWWTKEDEERLIAGVRAEIDAAKDAYLAEPKEPAGAMFDHLYERLPESIAQQRPWIERSSNHGDDHG
jgi:pyruvate dehydrogenase E1 component alpha subunit